MNRSMLKNAIRNNGCRNCGNRYYMTNRYCSRFPAVGNIISCEKWKGMSEDQKSAFKVNE